MPKLKKSYKTNVIVDTPNSTDEIPSHSHDRIAKAILQIITDGECGFTIGLEGDFGSGKSTIINLINNELSAPNYANIRLLQFDVWAHEGDNLRKIFLKRVIELLYSHGDKKTWFKKNTIAENILGQIENDKVGSIEIKNKIIVFLFTILILLLPTSINLIAKSFENGYVYFWDQSASIWNWHYLTGLTILLSFIFVSIIIFLKYSKSFLDIVVSKKVSGDYRQISSIDYDNWFIEVLANTLQDNKKNKLINTDRKKKNRKLIIVIDNLDRLAPNKRADFLSTLQTFLQHCHSNNPNYREIIKDHLIVIIPYNKDILQQNEKKDSGNKDFPSLIDEIQLFQKRIQINFEIPKMLQSNWENFLRNKLEYAFPEQADPKSIASIVSLARRFFLQHPPQPRQIIAFVNQMGALNLQWCSIIPLIHIAYFVLLNNYESNFSDNSLRDNKFPTNYHSNIIGDNKEEIRQNLICLYFNAEKDEAQQLLLMPELEKALINGQVKIVDNIISTNKNTVGTYISMIFEKYSQHEQLDIQTIFNLHHSINKCNHFKEISPVLLEKIDQFTKAMLLSIAQEEIITQAVSEKASYLIQYFSEDEAIVKTIIRGINPAPNASNIEDNISDDINTSILGVEYLATSLKFDYHGKEELVLYVKTSCQKYIQLIRGIYYDSQLEFANFFTYIPINQEKNSTFDISSILDYKPEDFLVEDLGVYKILDTQQIKYDLSPVSNKLLRSIVSGLETSTFTKKFQDGANNILETILYFSLNNSELLPKLVNEISPRKSGLLIRAIDTNLAVSDFANAARWFYFQYRCFPSEFSFSNPNFTNYNENFLERINEDDEKKLQKLLGHLSHFITENKFEVKKWFYNIRVDPKNTRILYFLLLEFSTLKRDFFDLDCQWLNKNWDTFRNSLNSNFEPFIKLLSRKYKIEHKMIEQELDFTNSKIYAHILNIGNRKYFADFFKNQFHQFSAEKWEAYFSEQDDVFLVLFSLIEREKYQLNLTTSFKDAYINFALKYLDNGISIKYHKKWKNLYKALHESELFDTRERIFIKLGDLRGNYPDGFFNYYGDLLIDSEVLKQRTHKFTQVFSPIITKCNDQQLQWLEKVFTEIKPADIFTDPNNEIEIFKDHLKAHLENNELPDSSKTILERLSQTIENSDNIS